MATEVGTTTVKLVNQQFSIEENIAVLKSDIGKAE